MESVKDFFQNWGNAISSVSLIATLAVILWYTLETRRLRRATVKQTELQLSPYVIVDWNEEGKEGRCKNVGNTSAINVNIEPQDVLNASGKPVFGVKLRPIYVLEPGENKPVIFEISYFDKDLESIAKGFEAEHVLFPFFPESFHVESYPLVIRYENVENGTFITEANIRVREKKVEIRRIAPS